MRKYIVIAIIGILTSSYSHADLFKMGINIEDLDGTTVFKDYDTYTSDIPSLPQSYAAAYSGRSLLENGIELLNVNIKRVSDGHDARIEYTIKTDSYPYPVSGHSVLRSGTDEWDLPMGHEHTLKLTISPIRF